MKLKFDKKTTWIVFVLIIISFLAIQYAVFFRIFTLTDDMTYYYIGKSITQGSYPYREIMAVHPPLHYYLLALSIKIFGVNFLVLKSITLFSVIIISFFLFKIALENFNEISAILSVILFLFSSTILQYTQGSNGAFETTAFIVAAYYFLTKKKYFTSGILFAFAGLTRLYFLPFFVICFFYSLFEYKDSKLFIHYKQALKFIFGFLIVFLSINIFFLMKYGKGFYTGVYLYQALGGLIRARYSFSAKLDSLWFIIGSNIIIFLLSFFTLCFKKLRTYSIYVVTALVYIIFIFQLKEIFVHYYLVILPFVALIGGLMLSNVPNRFNRLGHLFLPFTTIIVLILFVSASSYIIQNYNKIGQSTEGENAILAIANYIKSNSKSDDKIFGATTPVHFVALYSDRRIILDFVDQRVSGEIYQKFLDMIKDRKDLKYIVYFLDEEAGGFKFYGIDNDSRYKEFIEKHCREGKGFYEGKDVYILYECN